MAGIGAVHFHGMKASRCGKRRAPSCPPWICWSHPKRKISLMVNQWRKAMNFLAGARRRRNGETTVFGCFLKFEVAGSRQAFRAACSRFYQPAAAFRFRPKRPLQSEYFWDFWAFLQIGQLRCNKPPKPHPERYAPSYPGTAGRAEIRPAPEPWYGS